MAKRRRDTECVSGKGNFVHKAYDSLRQKLKACCNKQCPLLVKLLRSKRTEYRAVKAVIGFPFGLFYGYVLNSIVLGQLNLTPFMSQTLGYVLSLSLATGFAFSTQVRCICFLVLPTFSGRTGRAYISAYLISYVITGPVENMMSNGHESLRVLSCVMSLSLNHTVERLKLMFSPIKDIIREFTDAGSAVQKDAKQIDKTYEPIENEVKDEEEVKQAISDTEQLDREIGGKSRVDTVKRKFKKYKKGTFGGESEAKYGMKSEFRCEEVFTKGVRGCRDSFSKAYDRCLSAIPVIGYLLCWPMKLTFICDIASSLMGGSRQCDSKQVLSPGFGESVDTAEGVQKEFDKGFEVKMQYKLVVSEEEVDQLTPGDVGKAMENKFQVRKRNFEFLMSIINRVMAFMILQVFTQSSKYCNKYLRSIQFDNNYITSYFRHIDSRRRKQKRRTLLPLKKCEKLELSDPFQVRFSAEEKGTLLLNSLRLIGEVVTVTIILIFDRVFYELLMLIQRHSHVEYRQTGAHHVSLTIHGNGFIGRLVRHILKGFDKKHTTDSVTNTAECLPIPTKVDRWSVIRIYLIFLLMFVLMVLESYCLRFRRVVCAFFYPKREKKRVLFLYNDRLKKRKSFLHHMRHRVRKLARDQAIALDTGVFQSLRYMYPTYFSWLSKVGFGKRRCLVCEEVEQRKANFVQCSDECPFAYCHECWNDMKERCYVCLPSDDEDSELSEDEFSS